MGSISAFDPTGLLGVAAAFTHPRCDWKEPTEPKDSVYGNPKNQERAKILAAAWGKVDVTNKVKSLYEDGLWRIPASDLHFGSGNLGNSDVLQIIFYYGGKAYTLAT